MSYKMADTKWKFTAPQEGEVDSAEKKANTLREIDAAIPSPGILAVLTSQGKSPLVPDVTNPQSEWYDPTIKSPIWYFDKKQNKWVTESHYHPLPTSVPYAEESRHSKDSDRSKESDVASRLKPGFKINEKHTNGATDITLVLDDIPGSFRVWYGTMTPDKYTGFGKTKLHEKDLYVKITN